ncbi:uncharacterized protein [Branchiostoma lanceolatum]|uniref:uncharacterized protein n=1 Tax=Branchiostoma lanceolatum TaxID=7740 RepID=UPI003451815C
MASNGKPRQQQQQQPSKRKSAGKKGSSKVRRKLSMEEPQQSGYVALSQQQLEQQLQHTQDMHERTLDINDLWALMDGSQPYDDTVQLPPFLPTTASSVGAFGVGPTTLPTTTVTNADASIQGPVASSSSSGGGTGTSGGKTIPRTSAVAVPSTSSSGVNTVDAVPNALPANVSSVAKFAAAPALQPGIIPANGGFYTSLGENSQEVRFPLGDNVFLTVGVFNGTPLVSVRQFYLADEEDPTSLKPGKRGLCLKPYQWKRLEEAQVMLAITDWTTSKMSAGKSQAFKPRKFHLGNLRFLVVETVKGQLALKLWEYERPFNNLEPTNKGVVMKLPQWEALDSRKATVNHILEAVDKGKMPLDLEVIEGIPV